jgi:hypothetical protein
LILLVLCGAVVLSTQLGAGCTQTDTSSERSDTLSIPHSARVVDEGVGELSYVARSNGRVWLYDQDDKTVLDARRIEHGQEYRVFPEQNRVTLDNHKVYDQDIKRKHAHRIYFQSSSGSNDTLGGDGLNLPSSAKLVTSGHGGENGARLSYRARDRGHVYIVDRDDKRVVLDRAVHEGDEVVISTGDDRITINGRSVYDGNLERRHAHEIYFDKD